MANNISVRSYALEEVSFREVRRYMHCSDTEEANLLIQRVQRDVQSVIEPRVCYSVYDITIRKDEVCAQEFRLQSENLVKSLKNSHRLVMFSATLGISLDRLISRYSVTDPAAAVCAHALGAERVEALCDAFCEDMLRQAENDGCCTTVRFSPGYGDFSICNQSVFFEELSLNKNLGICLTDSYLMTPSKSVTAIFGIRKKECAQ